jgi:hypothetical protein
MDNVQNCDSYTDLQPSQIYTSDIRIVGGVSSLDFITSNEEFAFFDSKHEYVAIKYQAQWHQRYFVMKGWKNVYWKMA